MPSGEKQATAYPGEPHYVLIRRSCIGNVKLVQAKLLNYKSIIDAELKIQPDITCLVGMTGSGKTSVLELLSKIDDSQTFIIDDLPVKSDTVDQFQKDEISASEIKHLIATFDVEEIDRQCLPDGFDNLTQIEFTRFFDGGWDIEFKWSGEAKPPEGLQTEPETSQIEQILSEIDVQMDEAQNRVPTLAKDRTDYDAVRKNISEYMNSNPDEIGKMVSHLKNTLSFIRQDDQLRAHSEKAIIELESASRNMASKVQESRKNKIYEVLPRPEYIPNLAELADSMPLDEYLNDQQKINTFEAIGLICGFNKMQLNNIRNSEAHVKANYFDRASSKLTSKFSEFWSQAQYELIVELDGGDLVFSIKDKKSDLITKSTQCSEGLKWVLALFFKINTLVSSRGTSHILLFDSPATAVHDAGKEEIRRFLTKVSEKNRVQIVYATHEKALIDPWRLERIRFVSKEIKHGTNVSDVKNGGIDTARVEISKHIGSPAKYSLFGAPMIIHFEGRSDYRFVAALNEHAIDVGRRHLDPDLYSIDDLGGIDNARYTMKICKDLGLDFCFVVDGGPKSKSLKKDMGEEFNRHFVEISDIVDKDVADIEDIIDGHLYHHLFKKRYPDLACGDVPRNDRKKQITYYQDLLSECHPESRVDKGGIAKYLMDVVKCTPKDCEAPLTRTMNNYERLVDMIKGKLDIAANGHRR